MRSNEVFGQDDDSVTMCIVDTMLRKGSSRLNNATGACCTPIHLRNFLFHNGFTTNGGKDCCVFSLVSTCRMLLPTEGRSNVSVDVRFLPVFYYR